MIEREQLQMGMTYVRDTTGDRVELLDFNESLVVKDDREANWSLALLYKSIPDDGRRYVRRVSDFCNKYSPEEETEE